MAFLDDDDLWLPEKLERQLALLEQRTEIGLATCGYRTIDGQGGMLSEVKPWTWQPKLNLQTWLYSCPTVPSAVVVRSEWLEKAGGMNPTLHYVMDHELWTRLGR